MFASIRMSGFVEKKTQELVRCVEWIACDVMR